VVIVVVVVMVVMIAFERRNVMRVGVAVEADVVVEITDVRRLRWRHYARTGGA
jgi:hypothetical protein